MGGAAPEGLYLFEGFSLDIRRRSLRSGDREIELRPKSLDVLCHLVKNAGRVVTKDEIIEAVWSDVVVTDNSLTRCVSDIRAALGDTAQRIVKTAPRRGYVLAAPVADASEFASAHPAASRTLPPAGPGTALRRRESALLGVWRTYRPTRRTLVVSLALCAMLLGGAVALWRGPTPAPPDDRPSIAVLPFTSVDGEPQQDMFGTALSEDVTASLAKFASLTVIASGSANHFKGKAIDVRQIGRELGARYLLQGSLRRDTQHLRVTAQLIDATSGVHLWAERYDGDPSKTFAVHDDIVKQIVGKLVARVGVAELERVRRKPPATLQTYDLCVQANALRRTAEGDKRGAIIAAARSLYEKATVVDPSYAPAWLGLANTYMLAWLGPSPGSPIGEEFERRATIDQAERLARKAVELDGTLAEARASLAWILYWQTRPIESAAEFARAFELNPNLADGNYAIVLIHGGRAADAVALLQRIMRLDPFYPPTYSYFLGKAYFFLGQNDQAFELTKEATKRRPRYWSLVMLAAIAATTERMDEARTAAAELLVIDPRFTITRYLQKVRLTQQADIDRIASALRKAGLPE